MSEALTLQADDLASFRTLLATRGVAVDSVRRADDGTVGASGPTLLADGGLTGMPETITATEQLDVGAVLGRGGMGEVRLATQRSLRREVAVKTVLDKQSIPAQRGLLKEAWAGGALEHPSVVPVHTLTRLDGTAAVVMKRIAGASWASLIAEPTPRFSGDGALEAHLGVLVQVCHAVAFAHERGILHLDLKPENVMVGELGEVYVLDWGLAAATEGGPDWLPRAHTMSLPAGTPGYMAPELAGAEGERIGPTTDVYLLGALLHHVVTGDARHHGESLLHVLLRAYHDDPPSYPPSVPRGLAAILTRAMQREPADRYPSADAFREAVQAFLRHRPADHFVERAEAVLADLERRLGSATKGDPEIEPLLAECEVALEQARREWDAHPGLRPAERALVVRRATHALVEERLDAARALLAELDDPPPALRETMVALERRIAERERYEQNLEHMGRELDLSLGTADRRRLVAVFGVAWAVLSVAFGVVQRSGLAPFGYRELLVEGGLLVATLVPFAWLRRDRYLANRANRRLWGGLAFLALAVEVFFGAAALSGIPAAAAVAMTPVIYTFGFAALAMALDRRIGAAVPVMLLTGVGAVLAPRYAFDVIGVGGGLATFALLAAWSRARPAPAA